MYRAFLSPELAAQLADTAQAVPEVPGLQVTPALLEDFPDIESPAILGAVEVFGEVQGLSRRYWHSERRTVNSSILSEAWTRWSDRCARRRWTDGHWSQP